VRHDTIVLTKNLSFIIESDLFNCKYGYGFSEWFIKIVLYLPMDTVKGVGYDRLESWRDRSSLKLAEHNISLNKSLLMFQCN